jgi:polysaccharide biosynthesis transport protein
MKDLTKLEPLDYLKLPWKRRWYFLAAMVLVLAAVAVYAALHPNLYRSETKILVESATLLDDPLSPSESHDRTEERIDSIRQLLQSRTVLQRIVSESRMQGVRTNGSVDDAMKSIQNNVDVIREMGSTFTLSFKAPDPRDAQSVTHRLAEILIEINQASKKNKAMDKDQFLEQELRQGEQELASIDDKIKQFKASHLGELPEQSNSIMNALTGLHNQLVAVDSALDRARDQQKTLEFRIQEQRRLSNIAKSLSPKEKSGSTETKDQPLSPLASRLVEKRSQLAEATARLTQKHPDVILLRKEVEDLEKQVTKENEPKNSGPAEEGTLAADNEGAKTEATEGKSTEISQVELGTEAEIAQATYELNLANTTIARREKEREDILKSISNYQSRLNLSPTLEQTLTALMREHDTKQQQVSNLESRKFNAQMAANAASDKKSDLYRILDEAYLPVDPIFPTRLHIIAIGILLSLLVGFAASVAREYFESSLANEEEVAGLLKLPVLASIPEIPENGKL